jgi:hypothetical protein
MIHNVTFLNFSELKFKKKCFKQFQVILSDFLGIILLYHKSLNTHRQEECKSPLLSFIKLFTI